MPLLSTLLIAGAMAQDAPATDATLLLPAIDGDRTMFTEDATIGAAGHGQARAIGSYALNPLENGGTQEDAGLLYVIGGETIGPVRLGGGVPIVATSGLGDEDARYGIGDVLVDGKLALIRPARSDGFGLALQGSATLPSATVEEFGRDGIGWKAGGVGEVRGGAWGLAANAGVAGGPDYRVGNDTVDEELYGNLALSFAPTQSGAGVAVELISRTDLADPFADEDVSPAEAVLGGWYRFDDAWTLRGGVGTGINDGIGASDGRVVLGVSYSPPSVLRRTETAAR